MRRCRKRLVLESVAGSLAERRFARRLDSLGRKRFVVFGASERDWAIIYPFGASDRTSWLSFDSSRLTALQELLS